MMTRPPSSSESSPSPDGDWTEGQALTGDRIEVIGGEGPESEPVLTPDALEFIARLARGFGPRRDRLLADRAALAGRSVTGPPSETHAIRDSSWAVSSPPPGLETRWVEIVGEPRARTIVGGLNSKADVFVADFEDLFSPVWENLLHSQWNLARAVRRTLEYTAPGGDRFRVVSRPATLMVRPRGWHLVEPHVQVDGHPVPASLFDAGLYAFHNAHELVRCGSGPYFYLPKMEHYLEAALWEEVFEMTERALHLRPGTVRATAIVETVAAAWETEEILFALRPHSAGLAFGRMGLTFSQLKGWRDVPPFPDPAAGMAGADSSFAAACSRSVIETSHRRGTQAMNASPVYLLDLESGGPSRRELAQDLAEKVRDARAGYDGTWVVHPGAVPAVREFFATRPASPQVPPARARSSGRPQPNGMPLPVPTGPLHTPRSAIRAALRYLDGRFRGAGTVIVDHAAYDTSSVEVARAWLWLWTHFDTRTRPGEPTREEESLRILGEELAELRVEAVGDARRLEGIERAARLVNRWARDSRLPEFLTVSAAPGAPN